MNTPTEKISYYAVLAMFYLGNTCLKNLIGYIDGTVTDNSSIQSSAKSSSPGKYASHIFAFLTYNFYLIIIFLAEFLFSLAHDS